MRGFKQNSDKNIYTMVFKNAIILKLSIILTTRSENSYYTITIHFHAHFQCLETGGPILPSFFPSRVTGEGCGGSLVIRALLNVYPFFAVTGKVGIP